MHEQAASLRQGGAAVTLWSNGSGILGELEVSLDGVGAPIDALEQRTYDGKVLISVDVARSALHYGHPHICLPRRRLLERLAEGPPAEMIRFGRSCTKVIQDDTSVRAEFDDGSTESCDLLIGADGRRGTAAVVVRPALDTASARARIAGRHAAGPVRQLGSTGARGACRRERRPAGNARGYEHARAPKAGLVARQAGKEDISKYRPWLTRLLPEALLSRYYTRWLGQVSNYLP